MWTWLNNPMTDVWSRVLIVFLFTLIFLAVILSSGTVELKETKNLTIEPKYSDSSINNGDKTEISSSLQISKINTNTLLNSFSISVRFLEEESKVSEDAMMPGAEYHWRVESSDLRQMIIRVKEVQIMVDKTGIVIGSWGENLNEKNAKEPINLILKLDYNPSEILIELEKESIILGSRKVSKKIAIPEGVKLQQRIWRGSMKLNEIQLLNHMYNLWACDFIKGGKTIKTISLVVAAAPISRHSFEKSLGPDGPGYITIGAIPGTPLKNSKNKHAFAMYKVTSPVNLRDPHLSENLDLQSLTLEPEPLLTDNDIILYNWAETGEHLVQVTTDAHERMMLKDPEFINVPFVVVSNGERIYLGAFMGMGSSIIPLTPVILKEFGKDPMISPIDGSKKHNAFIINPVIVGKSSPITDPRILKALKKRGILRIRESEKKVPASSPPAKKLSEQEKIEYLLKAVLDSGLSFIRNGQTYPAKQAEEHLRKKWDYARKRIKTAEQFIEYIASKSSMSEQPYSVILKDGTKMTSEAWFHEQLKKLEKTP